MRSHDNLVTWSSSGSSVGKSGSAHSPKRSMEKSVPIFEVGIYLIIDIASLLDLLFTRTINPASLVLRQVKMYVQAKLRNITSSTCSGTAQKNVQPVWLTSLIGLNRCSYILYINLYIIVLTYRTLLNLIQSHCVPLNLAKIY